MHHAGAKKKNEVIKTQMFYLSLKMDSTVVLPQNGKDKPAAVIVLWLLVIWLLCWYWMQHRVTDLWHLPSNRKSTCVFSRFTWDVLMIAEGAFISYFCLVWCLLFSQNKVHQLIIFHLLSETLCCIYNVLYLGPSPLYMSINISYQPLSRFIALNHGL